MTMIHVTQLAIRDRAYLKMGFVTMSESRVNSVKLKGECFDASKLVIDIADLEIISEGSPRRL